MIDFELGPELEQIRATARAFAQERLRPRERESERERRLPDEVHALFREIGLAALEWPEALGGAGLGALARALVLEELAAADAGAALALDPLGPALHPLAELGGVEALERFAAPLLAASSARAVLWWDGAERLRPEHGRLTGELSWVPADRVDLLVVLQPGGALVVREGIRASRLRGLGLRAAGASALALAGAPVAAALAGRSGASRALARARLHLAALLNGVMRAAAEFSRGYATERVAFGRPIAHHQGLAFLIADMAAAVDGTRLLLHEAAWRLDAGLAADEAAATAFIEAAEQALFVTPNAVQILGGHGFMQDYPVEKYMRDARALSLCLGGSDAAREDAGAELARSAAAPSDPRAAL
jgi:alkylation response protein AidB-like acyl-CoA dehydrogenase